MRLKSVRIAGFKSFVSPVTVPLSGQFCAVVGPNGAGKSNIVDAVRWVLGELSARQLRGHSMADVIFNGSARSKPLGRASVELLLDNSDASLAGRHAGSSEVAVRRAVTRDGESEYRINGVACRRRDVLDLFRDGAGAGTAYAVIGQDMIGSVTRATPVELRGYLEAAAGMSQYHARRQETERRMRDARANIARLGDIRAELKRQLRQLRGQANMAKRYAGLRDAARRLSAQIDAAAWRCLQGELGDALTEVSAAEAEVGRLRAERDSAERAARQLRESRDDEAARRERERSRLVELDLALSSARSGIEAARQRERDLDENLETAERSGAAVSAQLEQDRGELEGCRADAERMDQGADALSSSLDRALTARADAERELKAWQRRWDEVDGARDADEDAAQSRARDAAARCAVHEAWLEAATDADDPEVAALLSRCGLDGVRELAGRIVVHDGWEAAVDTVLASFVRAVVVDDIDSLRPALDQLRSGALALLEPPASEPDAEPDCPLRRAGAVALAEKVSAPAELRALLRGLYGAESLAQALAWRGMLSSGESLLTRDGAWCGPNWLRLARGERQVGPLGRRREWERADALRRTAEAELQAVRSRRRRRRERLLGERERRREAFSVACERSDAAQAAWREFSVARRALDAQAEGVAQGIARAEAQLRDERVQAERWERARREVRERSERLERDLAPLGAQRAAVEARLDALRERAAESQRALSGQERRLAELDRALAVASEPVQELKLRRQRLESEIGHLAARVAERGFAIDELAEQAAAEEARSGEAPSVDALRAELERVNARAERIGNVNLAAADDFAERQERKERLDAQDLDMRQALERLEQAMRQIDGETRSRLRAVIDEVNVHLRGFFAQLFGGGDAALRLGDGDVLNAELSLRVGLPGRRPGGIVNLSGGEQALTATALLFSLLSVNPAPFCLLDEADSALDDVNVARFAELVVAMSSRVQVVCVTHNRATMQAADQLIGVAMRDPGASQVVSVDLDAALAWTLRT